MSKKTVIWEGRTWLFTQLGIHFGSWTDMTSMNTCTSILHPLVLFVCVCMVETCQDMYVYLHYVCILSVSNCFVIYKWLLHPRTMTNMGVYTIHPLVTICMYCYSVSYDLYEWFLYLVVLHVMEPKPIVELHTF